MRELQVRELAYLPLGRQGENNAQKIVWHGIADSWARLYGEGVFALTVKRQNDSAPYPASITSENGDVVWAISAADTAQAGEGMAELTYTVGGVIAKSRTWRTVVERSLSADGTSDPPEPQKSWVDEVLAAGAEAKTAAASAEEDAEAAEKAAAAAAGSAEAAGKSAQSAQRAADSAGTLASDAASSAAAARNAASSASGSAASAGSSAGSANGAASRAASSEANAKTSETNAKASADAAAEALTKAPYVGENGNWWVWNAATGAYQDTGVAATGPTGATGATGATGPQGDPGTPGTKWVVSADQPNTSKLNDGDLWLLNSRHGQYYPGDVLKYVASGDSLWPWVWVASIKGSPGETGAQGPQGATGATGPAGADGVDGVTPYIGDNGNWYIGDTDTGIVAEGQDGADGAKWFAQADEPQTNVNAGDYWLDSGTGLVYRATNSSGDTPVLWKATGANLTGPTGETGPAGEDGKTPVKGVDYFTEDDMTETEELNIPTGILKGTASGIVAAEEGVDYMAPVAVTAADNGKFLRVVNGAWGAAAVANASGVSF